MGHGVCRRGPNSNRPTPNCCVLNSHATTPQCELKLLARPMVSRTTESNRHPHGVLREGLLTCHCFTLRRTAMTMERSYLKLKAAESEANRLGKAGAALKSPSAKKAIGRAPRLPAAVGRVAEMPPPLPLSLSSRIWAKRRRRGSYAIERSSSRSLRRGWRCCTAVGTCGGRSGGMGLCAACAPMAGKLPNTPLPIATHGILLL